MRNFTTFGSGALVRGALFFVFRTSKVVTLSCAARGKHANSEFLNQLSWEHVNKFRQFFTQMDRKAFRAVGVVLCMFAAVAILLFVSRAHFQISQNELMKALVSFGDSPWALPLTIAMFTGAAFIGAPQWLLIGATVLAFGPQTGGLYAWAATLISASFDFHIARFLGAARIEALSGRFLARITGLVQRNGFLTSFAVRLVPTGPFVLVNMTAGVSGLRFLPFALGTALGIIPKILVVVLLGQGALTAAQGERFMMFALIGALIVIVVMLLARRLLQPYVKPSE